MVKFVQQLVFITSSLLLTACVTQNFDKDTPVIEPNSSNKDLAVGRVALGLGYLKMGNTTQAKFNLEKAKKFDPNLMEVYTAFAHYYETVDEPELSVKSFEKALSIKADDANTLNNYGVFLCRQEQYIAAEKQFLKAIAIPSYLLVSKSYENLASCQLKAGDFDKAERYLSKAITHSPNSSTALFQMIQLEYAMGNYKKARRYTQKFEKVTRRFKPDSLALALKVYQQLGDQKIARNYGSMLVSMYPDSWEAKQYILNGLERTAADDLAEKYQEVKSNDKSKKSKKRVIVLSPHNKPAIQTQQQTKVEPKTEFAQELPELAIIDSNTPQVSPITKAVIINEVAKDNELAKTDVAKESIDQEKTVEENTVKESTDKESTVIESVDDEVTAKVIESDTEKMILPTDEAVVISSVSNEVNNDELLSNSSSSELPASSSNAVQESIEPVVSEVEETLTDDLIDETLTQETLTQETLAPRQFHIVVKGDNLYGISVKYNTQIKALLRFNALDENSKIHIGDKIFVTESLVEEALVEENLNE